MTAKLTVEQARRLVITSQRIYSFSKNDKELSPVNRLLHILKHLSYVQIDTISVVQRAHHQVFWTRHKNYKPEHLEQAIAEKKAFEYWSHAAAYLPMSDYRFSLAKKQELSAGGKHWHQKDPKQAAFVLDAIKERGPMRARDFQQERSIRNPGWGDRKPAKQALERLFMEGALMIVRRDNFQKVFDLAERVLPRDVDTTTPSETEYLDYLIHRCLDAQGFANARQIAYLRTGLANRVQQRCDELVQDGVISTLSIEGQTYYAIENYQERLQQSIPRTKIRIVSPFDNLVIQRKRLLDIFNFDYQIECYVPAAKRKFGYFVLPILQGSKFIARMDAKVDRKNGVLHLKGLWFESPPKSHEQERVITAISEFAEFNDAIFDPQILDQ